MEDLPKDILSVIFSYNNLSDIITLKVTCKKINTQFDTLFWIKRFQDINNLSTITSHPKINKYLRCIRNTLIKRTNPIISCCNSYDRWYYHNMAQFFSLYSYTIIDNRQYRLKCHTTAAIRNEHSSRYDVTIEMSLEARSMVG